MKEYIIKYYRIFIDYIKSFFVKTKPEVVSRVKEWTFREDKPSTSIFINENGIKVKPIVTLLRPGEKLSKETLALLNIDGDRTNHLQSVIETLLK